MKKIFLDPKELKTKNKVIRFINPAISKVDLIPTSHVIGDTSHIPLLGRVAAGFPIEAVESSEYIEIPKSMVRRGAPSFALKVKGDSMVDENISDGDYVIIQKQKHANNGDLVVAIIDNNATLKRFYKKSEGIELHAANKNYSPIRVQPSSQFEILGVLTGVIRRY